MFKVSGKEALKALIDEVKRLFVQKEEGKGLSTNDYTDEDKAKIRQIPEGASFTDTTYDLADGTKAGLTEENFTKANKEKLSNIETGAKDNIIEKIQRNGINISPTDKTINIEVPSSMSDLINDKGYKTEDEIIALVQEHGKIKREIIDSLPDKAGAKEGVLYLVKNSSDSGYDEYIIVNGEWEILGSTNDVDLTGYVKEKDFEFITSDEVLEMFNATV